MVTCSTCGVVQSGTERCLACGGPVVAGGIAPPIDGWLPFRIGRDEALAALPTSIWKLPTARMLDQKLTRCWMATWRCDVRLDTAWEAEVQRGAKLELRAGWVDQWLDEVVAPGFQGLHGTGSLSLGEREALPTFHPDPRPDQGPWLAALAKVLANATGAREARAVWTRDPPLEQRWSCVASPVWVAVTDHGVFHVHGETGEAHGQLQQNRRQAWLASTLLTLLGLGTLAASIVVAVPGLLIWPLLLVTALGALVGFALLVAAGLPPSWSRLPR